MKKTGCHIIVLTVFACLLSCCVQPTDNSYNKNVSAMNTLLTENIQDKKRVQENSQPLRLPEIVIDALMPSLAAFKDEKTSVESRFDISVDHVNAEDFFTGLTQRSGLNVILAPGISGQISLQLKQASLREVLDAVSQSYGFYYEKNAYGYTIYPRQLQTRIFMMNHLSLQRTLKTNTQLNNSSGDLTQTTGSSSVDNHGSSVTPSTITIEALQQDDFWTDLQLSLLGLVGAKSDEKNVSSDQAMVKVNAGTGLIIVRTYPKEMRLVEEYLAKTQHILGREVIIEAEILDVTLSSEYSSGIDWSVLTAGGTTSGNAGLLNSGTMLSNVYTLSMSGDNNNFSYALNLLSTQGKVSVLSKPRISTMNNQSAIIKIGSDSYYVTSVESQLNSGGNNSSDTTTSTINLQAYFSGIALYVTPQITDDGEVNLHIHPSVSQVTENTLNVTVDNQESVLPVARSQIRETDTMVRARDGQVVILGGLMQTGVSGASSGLPLKPSYSNALGSAITSKEHTGVKSELVILLRPIIVQEGVWSAELGKIAKTAYTRQSEKEVVDDPSRP